MKKINFKKQKKALINKLDTLYKQISLIEQKFEIEFNDLKKKIETSIDNIKTDRFSIAFFGAFSDGKSSILYALIQRLDIEISPEPTTDRIKTYEVEDYFIIDTPGLFSEKLLHDSITKKYISEANLILYTVDSVNPLKKSHWNTVKWILSELKKGDVTIFIINKMDEVADLENEKDFKFHSDIKKSDLVSIIEDITGIKNFKNVVCISADPYGKGLSSYWLRTENYEQYKKLSRIESLNNLIHKCMENYKEDFIRKAGISVMLDTINLIKDNLNEIRKGLFSEFKVLSNEMSEHRTSLKVLEEDIERSYRAIKNDILSLREKILVEIDASTNSNELASVLQKFVGKDGYVLQEKINNIVEKNTAHIIKSFNNIKVSVINSYDYHKNFTDNIINNAANIAKYNIKNILITSTARDLADRIIKTRNSLNIPIKFKPWGAIKYAKRLQAISVLFDIIDICTTLHNQSKFIQGINDSKSEIENIFKQILQEDINYENYIKNYSPNLLTIRELIKSLTEEIENIQEKISNIDDIIKNLESIKLSL